MKSLLALIALCLPLTAQTLTINQNGEIRLSPTPAHGAELYSADSPRSKNWEFVTEFAAATRIDTNKTKFYRAVVNGPPLKLLDITYTNQTIRGRIDSDFESLHLVVSGKTNIGWCYTSKTRLDTNSNWPVVVSRDFCFRHIPVTNTTPALLIITDTHGNILQTNLFIGPGPFAPLLPRHLRPQGLAPAAAHSPDPQTQVYWGLTAHSSSQNLEIPDSDYPACTKNTYKFSGSWDGTASRLDIERKVCWRGGLEECTASYAADYGTMFLVGSSTCALNDARRYMAVSEIGAYNSDTDDEDIASRLEYKAGSSGELWIGGQVLGPGVSNYWARVSIGLETVSERLFSEFIWESVSFSRVNAIGGIPTKDHSIFLQVPPEGVHLDCTPGFSKFSSGLYRWWPGYILARTNE